MLSQSGCSDSNAISEKEDIIVDAVYLPTPREMSDPGMPIETDVYLDEKYLGKTPIRFTPEKRQKLGLPDYERIEIDEITHWMTWDLGGRGVIEVAHPHLKESKKRIILKKPATYGDDTRFTGMSVGQTESGGMRLTLRLEQISKSEPDASGQRR